MASCSICYDDNKIKNDFNCRICNNSVCNTCFSNILLSDENFTFCIITIYLSYIIVVIVNQVIDCKKITMRYNMN